MTTPKKAPESLQKLSDPEFEFEFSEIHEQVRDLKTAVSESIDDPGLRTIVLEKLKHVQLDLLNHSIS